MMSTQPTVRAIPRATVTLARTIGNEIERVGRRAISIQLRGACRRVVPAQMMTCGSQDVKWRHAPPPQGTMTAARVGLRGDMRRVLLIALSLLFCGCGVGYI